MTLIDPARVSAEGAATGTYAALACLLGGGDVDPRHLGSLLSFVDSRRDCSDFRLLVVLKLLYAERVGAAESEAVRRTVTGFRYWMTEPGTDAMCHWSENHQILFAVCEYLAGSYYPDDVFTNDRRSGRAHRDDARERLLRWLELRFRFGFSEWLSSVYYEEDAAALSVLIDHVDDPTIAERASGVLDLLLLDCALHRFEGQFVASAGRLYVEQKLDPAGAQMQLILEAAFTDRPLSADWDQLGMVFVLRTSYVVPRVLTEIAHEPGRRLVRTSHGLDLTEALTTFPNPRDPETTGALLWAMEAFVNPEAVETTMRAFDNWQVRDNPFLSDLRALERVPGWVLLYVVRLLNPVHQGTALERADVQTYRSDSFLLSSAQLYRPRAFGDQQHLWQLALPGGVSVFGTHPGGPLVDNATRQKTPSEWVGNGVNPSVGQDGGLLMALYDTTPRRGYGESKRRRYSHVRVPFDSLDDVSLDGRALFLGKGSALAGLIGSGNLRRDGDEVRVDGLVTGWLVVGGELSEYGSLAAFAEVWKPYRVKVEGRALTASTPRGRYRLTAQGLSRDGVVLPSRYHRYDASPWVKATRDPVSISVVGRTGRLALTRAGGRTVTDVGEPQ